MGAGGGGLEGCSAAVLPAQPELWRRPVGRWVLGDSGRGAGVDRRLGAACRCNPAGAGSWQSVALRAARAARQICRLLDQVLCSPPCSSMQAQAAARRGGRSGDADLPAREPLHERRAKFDSVRARQQVCCRHRHWLLAGWGAFGLVAVARTSRGLQCTIPPATHPGQRYPAHPLLAPNSTTQPMTHSWRWTRTAALRSWAAAASGESVRRTPSIRRPRRQQVSPWASGHRLGCCQRSRRRCSRPSHPTPLLSSPPLSPPPCPSLAPLLYLPCSQQEAEADGEVHAPRHAATGRGPDHGGRTRHHARCVQRWLAGWLAARCCCWDLQSMLAGWAFRPQGPPPFLPISNQLPLHSPTALPSSCPTWQPTFRH